MRMEEMMKELFKRGDEKESRAHDHLCQRQKSNNQYNQDADDDQFQFQFLAFYCRTKTSTTKGLDQMHNCISRVFTTKQKSKNYVMNNEMDWVHHGMCNHGTSTLANFPI